MRKIVVAFFVAVVIFFITTQGFKEETDVQDVQDNNIPWETFSYSTPSEISIFSSTDSIPWEVSDEKT